MAYRVDKIELNDAGFEALLNSQEVEALCQSEAQAIANRAGSGFKASTLKSGTRYIGFVSATTSASLREESENKTLSRAVIPHD